MFFIVKACRYTLNLWQHRTLIKTAGTFWKMYQDRYLGFFSFFKNMFFIQCYPNLQK